MKILTVFQLILSLLLVVVVMLQQRGSQAGIAFRGGGGGESFRSKRGLERFLFYSTIVFAVLFAANSILILVLQ